jgi:multicomponent Na+:H+ antiporter subunit E
VRGVLVVTWLTILWVILWRDLSIANVLSGILIGALVELAKPWRSLGQKHHTIRPRALVVFVTYFVWKLLEANIVLAREVLTPRNSIETGVIAVRLGPCSDLVVAIVANAISLTPGTLTLEVRREDVPTLYVHILHLHDIGAARADVEKLTDLVNAAFPSWSVVPKDQEGAS